MSGDGRPPAADRHSRRLLAVALGLLAASAGAAAEDLEGRKDPPFVPRVPDSVIRAYDVKRLDAYLLPLGPAAGKGFARSETVRGKVTFVLCQTAPDCSVLEAGEHYGDVYASVHVQPEGPASARAWITVVEASPATAGAKLGPSPRVEVRSTGPADPVRSGPDAVWQAEIAVTLWPFTIPPPTRPAPRGGAR